VTLVRQEARKLAEEKGMDLILTDGPPGIGCPAIASLGGASGVLIVTEPTVSGLHDMGRAADLAGRFGISAMTCVNKCDLNTGRSESIEKLAAEKNAEFIGGIPFDHIMTESMVRGKTLFEYKKDSDIKPIIRGIWDKIMKRLKGS